MIVYTFLYREHRHWLAWTCWTERTAKLARRDFEDQGARTSRIYKLRTPDTRQASR